MFGFSTHSCKICGSKHELSSIIIPKHGGRPETEWYCKAHCLSALDGLFLDFPSRMIATHPIVRKNFVYAYYDIREYSDFELSHEDEQATREILASIPSDKHCAYFDETASRKSCRDKTTLVVPALLPRTAVEYLTKQETWARIYPTLTAWSGAYKFYAPYGGEGFFGSF